MSEPGDGGEVPVAAPDAGAGAHAVSAARPVVLPETLDGTKNWDEWFFHFENVAAVNGWDDADKAEVVTGSRNWESTESAAPSARIIATNVRGDADSSAGAIRSRKPTHTVPSGAPDTSQEG